MKICKNCQRSLSKRHFNLDNSRPDKLQSFCTECKAAWRQQNRRSIARSNKRVTVLHPWYRTFRNINSRCNWSGNPNFAYYGGRGVENRLTLEEIKYLWFRDKAYRMKEPSIDRLDPDWHYTLSNCQYLEKKENTAKRRTVLQFLKQITKNQKETQNVRRKERTRNT